MGVATEESICSLRLELAQVQSDVKTILQILTAAFEVEINDGWNKDQPDSEGQNSFISKDSYGSVQAEEEVADNADDDPVEILANGEICGSVNHTPLVDQSSLPVIISVGRSSCSTNHIAQETSNEDGLRAWLSVYQQAADPKQRKLKASTGNHGALLEGEPPSKIGSAAASASRATHQGGRAGWKCAVLGCYRASGSPNVSFHRIPTTDEVLRKKWLTAIRPEEPDWNPGTGSRICARHFRPVDLTYSGNHVAVKSGVVPSLFPRNDFGSRTDSLSSGIDEFVNKLVSATESSPAKGAFASTIIDSLQFNAANASEVSTSQQHRRKLLAKMPGAKPITSKGCCMPGCASRNYDKVTGERVPLSFHRFPKDPDQRNQWVKTIGRSTFVPTDNTRVCSKHFEAKFLVRNPNSDGYRLVDDRGAVPTLFLPSVSDQSMKLATACSSASAADEAMKDYNNDSGDLEQQQQFPEGGDCGEDSNGTGTMMDVKAEYDEDEEEEDADFELPGSSSGSVKREFGVEDFSF